MEIIYYEDKYLSSLNELLDEAFQIMKIYRNAGDDIELLMINEEKVIGYLCLNKCINLITGRPYFYVNYVCVKKEFRRRGVATALIGKAIEICKNLDLECKVSYLELTSNPSRVAAHELYKKLGFVVRETTVFRKELD